MKPHVGISSCLLGEKVRYDGRDKHHRIVVEALSVHFEWLPVCPEVEIGMGVPREPIELHDVGGTIRLLGVESARDWTDQMNQYGRSRTTELAGEPIYGFVLKSGSPSCGIAGVKVQGRHGALAAGDGMFTRALRARLPALPIADERQLENAAARAAFIERVRGYHDRLVQRQRSRSST